MRYNPTEYDPEKDGFQMPEAGAEVEVEILGSDTKMRESKAGNEMLQIKAEVAPGQVGAGYHLYDYIVDNGHASQNLGKIMEAVGIDAAEVREISPELFHGKKGFVRIKHETFIDKLQAKINYWLAADGRKSPSEGCESPDSSVDESGDDDLPF